MTDRSWVKAVSIGRGGISAYGDSSTGSGWIERDIGQCADGTSVIDSRTVPDERILKASLSSPMLDTRITQAEAAPEIPDYMLGPGGLSGDFATVAGLAKAGAVNLGKCGLTEWLAYWRNEGARIGYVQQGSIVWVSREPTVKTATLDGVTVDTYKTEREHAGIRESQGEFRL